MTTWRLHFIHCIQTPTWWLRELSQGRVCMPFPFQVCYFLWLRGYIVTVFKSQGKARWLSLDSGTVRCLRDSDNGKKKSQNKPQQVLLSFLPTCWSFCISGIECRGKFGLKSACTNRRQPSVTWVGSWPEKHVGPDIVQASNTQISVNT